MIFVKIILVLGAIQASRAVLFQLMIMLGGQPILYNSFSLIIIGIALLLIIKPNMRSMSLNLNELSRRGKRITIVISVLVLLLAIASPSNYSGNVEDIVSIVESVLIFPVFEELVFRGFIWTKLEEHNYIGLKAYIITTILFGIWHLGYWDVIYLKTSQNFADVNIYQVMFFKVLVGMAYGVFAGFTRYKAKNSYSSILMHSFLNIFGR